MKKLIITSLIGLCVAVIAFAILLEKEMQQPLPIMQKQLLTVDQGSSVGSLATHLVNQGWLKNRFWLRAYARLFPEKAEIKAGTYQVLPQANLYNVLALLTHGKEHQFQLTFIEGSTFEQWLVQLKNQPELTHSLKGLTLAQITQHLGIKQANPEGWFFPETYSYTKGTSSLTILQRAHNEMKNTLESLWESRAQNLPYKNAYQALIMASIIEKETSVVDEMPLISSVFVNRLRKKMRLQTDPTVIYGLGDRYQGDIKKIHLREKTPYNTYRINGLPPTPIAMPGKLAIKAALNPDTTDYLYFVSMGNGAHVFSTNLVEHNKAVVKYQLRKQ